MKGGNEKKGLVKLRLKIAVIFLGFEYILKFFFGLENGWLWLNSQNSQSLILALKKYKLRPVQTILYSVQ